MRLLLDTNAFLWSASGLRELGPRTRVAVGGATELFVSVLAFAEVGIKVSVGKLSAPPGLREHAERSGLAILALKPEHGLAVGGLPVHHRDPFDRLLIAQAITEHLTIVTSDEALTQYDVPVIDARR